MKRSILIALAIILLLGLSGCCLSHEWADATCTAPKTCTKCGKTDGSVIPHVFSEATCTTQKLCIICSTVEGEPLGHTWNAATCEQPQTCSRCNETEGPSLGHTEGDSTVVSTDYANATETVQKACIVCKKTLANEDRTISSLQNGKKFLFTPSQIEMRLNKMFSTTISDFGNRAYLYSFPSGSYGMILGEMQGNTPKETGRIIFIGPGDGVFEKDKNNAIVTGFMTRIDSENYVLPIISAIIETCDPTLEATSSEKASSLMTVITDILNQGGTKVNGIEYVLANVEGISTFLAYIPQT